MIWFDTSFIKFRKSFIKFNKQLLVSILTGLEPQDYSPGMHGETSWPNYLRLPHIGTQHQDFDEMPVWDKQLLANCWQCYHWPWLHNAHCHSTISMMTNSGKRLARDFQVFGQCMPAKSFGLLPFYQGLNQMISPSTVMWAHVKSPGHLPLTVKWAIGQCTLWLLFCCIITMRTVLMT